MIPINTQLPIAVGFVDSRQGGRAENQDTCGYADTPLGLLVVVCDGMGGGPSGKAASSTATDVIIQTVRSGKQAFGFSSDSSSTSHKNGESGIDFRDTEETCITRHGDYGYRFAD